MATDTPALAVGVDGPHFNDTHFSRARLWPILALAYEAVGSSRMLATLPAIALILTAMLLGGMSLFAFGFAIFVLRHLPTDLARPLIRKAFPPY